MAVARSKVGSPASPKRLCRLTTAATSLSGCASTPLTPSDTSDQPPEGDALVGIAKKRMKRIAKLEKKGKISAGEAEDGQAPCDQGHEPRGHSGHVPTEGEVIDVRQLFTADLHLGHAKVAGLRGFDDWIHHDAAVANNWREVVGECDTVWILGDFSCGREAHALRVLRNLPGRKRLILGNHDAAHPMRRRAPQAL